MKKRIWAFILALVLLFPVPVFAQQEAYQFKDQFTYFDEVPTMLIGDLASENILVQKNIQEVRPLASMSKLVTYYVVMDAVKKGDVSLTDEVTISQNAAKWNMPMSSNYGLKEGEKLTISKLLNGLMVVSGNDAAVALAEAVGGSEEAFVEKMNALVQEKGFSTGRFVNASGFTEASGMNVMSAEDLYQFIVALVKEYPEVMEYAKTRSITEPERNYTGDSTIERSMQPIPGLKGLKTGVTDEAGYCFAGIFELQELQAQAEVDVVTIVMGAPTGDARYRTTLEMVELAAGTFERKTVIDSSIPYMRYEVPNAKEGSVILYPERSLVTLTYQNKIYDITFEVEEGKKAPTKEDEVFGQIYVYNGDIPVDRIPLVSHTATEPMDFWENVQRSFEHMVEFLGSFIQF